MKIYREVTKWEWPNHDYLLHNQKLVAYRKESSDQWEKFTKPMSFSGSRRKFIELEEPIPTEFVPFPAPRKPVGLEVFFA